MIKNECRHAYKLLDHAECLWCENCVEKLIKRLKKKPEVTEEWTREWHEKLMKFLQLACRQNSFAPSIKHKMRKLIDASSDNIKDFIRSLVEEIK